ncbi:MAG: tetratricopeptide repeat protein [Bacteroidales bacterium]|nr:tetratricopeptide repeat protein [Bacteroidales bacterium]
MLKKIATASLAAIMLATTLSAGVQDTKAFKEAVALYERGMYVEARQVFETIARETNTKFDAEQAEGYATLCAVRLQAPGHQTLVLKFDQNYPASTLRGIIHYANALNFFDKEEYQEASCEFALVDENSLLSSQKPEFVFKQAYSEFGQENYSTARDGFVRCEKMPFSDYTAPSMYSIAYIDYTRGDFDSAFGWFAKAAKDPRFAEISNYYMLECRFMNKDYRYVVENGVGMYSKIPEERKSHLARIISESYLVLGDSGNAKKYYENTSKNVLSMDRKDLFYAGSVLYAVRDWQGAVDNFSLITERTDSLGQIASYDLANSYLQLKNKVAAMEAFKEASVLSFDAKVQEDAMFNYAKLAFDLNNDTSGFADYLAKYADRKRGDSIYSYMALVCLANHDYAGAVAAYDKIEYLDSQMKGNYMKANYLRANQLILGGSYRDAIPCLRAASFYGDRRDTFNQLSRFWLAESYYRSEKYLDSRTIYTDLYNISALEGSREGVAIPYGIAYDYFKEGLYDEAAKWFGKYLGGGEGAELPYAKEAATRLADCDFIKDKYADAIAGYEKVIAEYGDVNDIYPYYQCGIAYGLSGKTAKKIEVLENVKGADSKSEYYPEAMYELGRAYVSAGREGEARLCFRELRNSHDRDYGARALIELGMIANNGGNPDEALECYKEVVSLMPDSEYSNNALLAIKAIYQGQGEAGKYIEYTKSLDGSKGASESEQDDIYFNAAEQMYFAENMPKAMSLFKDYLGRYPSGKHTVQSKYYLAECLRLQGEKEAACDGYEEVLKSGSTDAFIPSAALRYADLSYGFEHFEDAYKGYEILAGVSTVAQDRKAASLGMMRSAFRAKNYDDAISCADKVKTASDMSADLVREADYVKAKSLLATSRRDQAFDILGHLSRYPSTDEGAEAVYILIQASYDKGEFEDVEKKVYAFAEKAGGQNYWLAKAFIVLGDSFAERDNLTQAKATFESLKNGYSPAEGTTDDIADNVEMRLRKIEQIVSAY